MTLGASGSIAKLAGKGRNDITWRTGQICLIGGGAASLGFRGFGVEIFGQGAAPLVVMVVGLVVWFIGYQMEKEDREDREEHEIRLRRAERAKPDPTDGDLAMLEAFRLASRPLTRLQIADLPCPYHDDRTIEQLRQSTKCKCIDFWTYRGEIKNDNGVYDLRDTTDATVLQ